MSSYTKSQLIARETAKCISESLVMLINDIRPSGMTKMIVRADPHPSHRSLFNSEDSILVKHNVQLELGRVHNINHNPVAEKAARELIREILVLQPSGGAITSTLLSEATANLNSRIRAPGVSAHEIFTQRDQTTGLQLALDDVKLIRDQQQRRENNHKSSEKNKAAGKSIRPEADVSVGSIVYIYNDGSKLRARPRYIVLSVKEGWCKVRRLTDKQLGRLTYSLKLTEVYLVPDEFNMMKLPPLPIPDETEEDEVVMIQKKIPIQTKIPIAVEESSDDSTDEEKEDDDDDEHNEGEEVVDGEEHEDGACTICHRQVAEHHMGLCCDKCDKWSHRYCLKLTKQEYKQLMKREDEFEWTCPSCPQGGQPPE